MRAWNQMQLLTREGKDLKGIIFNLENNYGYSEKRQVELGERASRAVSAAGMTMEERQELLKACGFGAFCTFDAGQPVFHRL